MGENSTIEWTDHTWNPWRVCEHATLPDGSTHPGCEHCYAEAMSKRNPSTLGKWGADGVRVSGADAAWNAPLKWNRKAESAGAGQRVFFASLADVFEDWHGLIHDTNNNPLFTINGSEFFTEGEYPECRAATLHDLRRRAFGIIDKCEWLDFLVLTKRPDNVRSMWDHYTHGAKSPFAPTSYEQGSPTLKERPNVWLGTSVSNQQTVDALVPQLRICRGLASVLFLSIEPLLGPIELDLNGIDWVIVGGESGPHARPMHPDWVRSIRDQCQAAGVAFHFKQWGEWIGGQYDERKGKFVSTAPYEVIFWTNPGHQPLHIFDKANHYWLNAAAKVGKKQAGRMLDGREWNEFPEVSA